MTVIGYMAIDQYGQTYRIGDNPPRKWLLEHLGGKHADKMYVDRKDNPRESKHVGYVIAGLWLSVYRILPFKD